jgi:DNA polymerase-3 subunit beta
MKFTCNTKELSKACQTVSRAVATKATIPALECIKIEAKDSKIMLCGYNLELGMSTSIEAHGVSENGSILLDAKTICSIVKKLPDTFTTIEYESPNKVIISSGETKFEICSIDSKEYPELPSIDVQNSANIQQPVLKGMIQQTIFAVAESNAKPVHTGALFKIQEGSITVVGVDGYRLAKCHDKIDYSGKEFDFVVPKITLMEVCGLLSDDTAKMATISVDLRHAIFEIGDYEVFTRLLEGEFIEYDKMIPTEYKTEALTDVRSILDSTERVSLIVNDKLRSPLKMEVNHSRNRIELSCSTVLGAAHDALNAEISGDALTIGFNGKYLSDALKNVDCDEVKLHFSGPLAPMVILPDDGDSFVFLVLPVRLRQE